jgi:ribonuclease HI
MIISSAVVFPRKVKKFTLKKSREEIIKEVNILENKLRMVSRKNIPKEKQVIKEYDFIIFTDGGYSNTYKVGSWSYLIKVKYHGTHFVLHKSSGIKETDERLPVLMELMAVIEALKFILDEENKEEYGYSIRTITVYSDSRQVVRNKEYIKLYQQNDWFYLKKGYEMTEELKKAWNGLDDLNKLFKINYVWVRGHNGNLGNERCNTLCSIRLGQEIKIKKIKQCNEEIL